MIVCPKCKRADDINNENIKPIYSNGQIIRWEHKECGKDEDEEKSSSGNNQKRT